MKIGVDLDDTLGNFIPALVEFHNNVYGTKIKVEDFKSYRFWETWGGTLEQAVEKVYEFFKTPYFKNIKPVEGAKEVLERLKKNNELFIITARQESIRKETEEWLNKNYPNIFSKIYFTNQYSLGGTETTKKKICDELEMDVLIEDNINYTFECAGPNRKVYLIDRPWNQSAELPQNAKRVYSWKEINIK